MTDEEHAAFPGPEKYPKWLVPVALFFGLPLFGLFAYLGNPLRGFVAALSMSAMVVVIVTLWNFRRYIVFWICVIISSALHVILIYSIKDGDTHFSGIVFAPAFIADFLFWQTLVVWGVRQFRF